MRADLAESPEDQLLLWEMHEQIRLTLGTLMPRDGLAIVLRFGLFDAEPHTFRAMGRAFGVSKERARQIYERGMRQMRFRERIERLRPYRGD